MKLYRKCYLRLALIFNKMRCIHACYGSFKCDHDKDNQGIAVDSDLENHAYLIFHMTDFHNIHNWQNEEKRDDQSVLFNRCRFFDCSPLPENMHDLGSEWITDYKFPGITPNKY